MQYKTLGNTGLLVSRICLGTMTFAGKGFWTAIGKQDQPPPTRSSKPPSTFLCVGVAVVR